MSTLLVDIGNTRIKWARWDGHHLRARSVAAHAGWRAEDFARILKPAQGVTRILVSSVAAPDLTRSLAGAARRAGVPEPEIITTTRSAGGITVGYLEPWRLGVDRFLSTIGAHRLFPGRPLCVIGLGTAMTVDLVTARGRHLGGAIIPAPGLMVASLLQNTDGIKRRAAGGAAGTGGLFGRSTRAGILQGSRYAAAATIERALEEARRRLKQAPLAVLSGGGAKNVRPLVRGPVEEVDDLVLHGLAVLASVARHRAAR
jgi:type III pantothenate kinase